jgi:hypothetical protein
VPVKKYKKREALEADVSIIEDSSIKLTKSIVVAAIVRGKQSA